MKAYVKIRQAFCHAGVRAHSNEVTACGMSTSSLCKRKRCSLRSVSQISCVLHHQLNGKNPSRYLRGSRPLKGTALWRPPAGYTRLNEEPARRAVKYHTKLGREGSGLRSNAH